MFEVEIKVRILEPQKIKEVLAKNGGRYKETILHEDTYLNLPKGAKDLRESDEILRIRKRWKKERTGELINPISSLAYKGKKLNNQTKTRQEIKINIEEYSLMRELFRSLGFRELLTVKKERQLFDILYKDTEIRSTLDYIPVLDQYFLEVECLTDREEDILGVSEFLFEFLHVLGIKREESIPHSYLELILNLLP